MSTGRMLLLNPDVGTGAQAYQVCGRSGKVYGQAHPDPARRGQVFEMSMDDYRMARLDLIGNDTPGQRWVPEYVPASNGQADATNYKALYESAQANYTELSHQEAEALKRIDALETELKSKNAEIKALSKKHRKR